VQVIGVIDLRKGRAVHARGGVRDRYEPVHIPDSSEPGDVMALAAWYAHLGLNEVYVADLDAIEGGAPHHRIVGRLAASRTVWLDAGIASVDQARSASALSARHTVVGLETLTSYRALGEICAAVSGSIAFSLDLRCGEPILHRTGEMPAEPPEAIAGRAADAGVHAIIVLDLARVGTGAGIDTALLARIRKSVPGLMLLAGGGVGSPADLARLADVGCDAALVATALLDGRVGTADLATIGHRNVVRQTAD
jgi:phosphoribosylformimino-5-aminoimidazole carboxamide ribotide isomerase